MLEIFNIIFGEAGNASSFFGDQWWLVGFFLLLVISLYFYGKGLSTEGLILTLFSGVLLLQLKEIFAIANDYILLIVVIFVLFIGFTFYRIMER